MIELDLRKVLEHLVWKLEVLAVIRRVCAANGVDFRWCVDQEDGTAKVLRDLRKVIKVKGDVLVVKPKG
ncbi:hypothetical protein ES708_25380 [subsurface metagenome]